MKRILVGLSVLLFAGLVSAQDLIDVAFQSKWFPQAQFAGYFVAQSQGFYEEEGLNVTVLDGGNVNPTVQVASGNADFGTDWIANMLVQREQGLNVVQIAQIYQASGYRLVALNDAGIEEFADLAGRTVGVWGFGNEFVAQADFRRRTAYLRPRSDRDESGRERRRLRLRPVAGISRTRSKWRSCYDLQ